MFTDRSPLATSPAEQAAHERVGEPPRSRSTVFCSNTRIMALVEYFCTLLLLACLLAPPASSARSFSAVPRPNGGQLSAAAEIVITRGARQLLQAPGMRRTRAHVQRVRNCRCSQYSRTLACQPRTLLPPLDATNCVVSSNPTPPSARSLCRTRGLCLARQAGRVDRHHLHRPLHLVGGSAVL